MSDVYEVGGVEAKLTVDSSQFDHGMDQSGEKLEGFRASVSTLPANIQKLIQKEKELARQMQDQRQKIAQMDAALDEAKEMYAELQRAAGSYSDEDMASHFAKEDAAIQKEEEALSSLAKKLQLVEQQHNEAQASFNKKAGLTSQKEQYKSTSLVIDSMANSLRAASPIIGDSVGNIGNLAERLIFLKQSMNAAKNAGASAGAVMGSAISGGVTLAVSAVSMLISSIQQAEEERKQAYEQAMADLEEYEQQVRDVQQSLGILDDATSSTNDMLSAREKIAEIFPNMVLGYTKEGDMILKNNEALQDQLEILREKERLTNKEIANSQDDILADYFSLRDTGVKSTYKNEGFWGYILDFLGVDPQDYAAILPDDKDTLEFFEATAAATEKIEAKFKNLIPNYYELDEVQKTVADSMIDSAVNAVLAAETEEEANDILLSKLKEIKSVLSDEKTYTDRYQLIIDTGDLNGFTEGQVSMIDEIGQDIMDKLKKQRTESYEQEIEDLEQHYDDLYESQKAAIDREYKAVETALEAQQQAYKQLSFNVKSLDEQDLANKMDLLDRRLKAEEDTQSKAILAVQQRYYKETQLIIKTANTEIQAYKDKLAALDQADKDMEAARKARQDQAAIRDLNEQMAKQEAENTREMAEALQKYEEERDRLQTIVDNPPTQTARVIAERDLTKLNESWLKEREQLETEHSESILKIQRELDEEKLTQQEDAAAAEREKERENLNLQITAAEETAAQKLQILNNTYTVETELQEKILSEHIGREKKAYQDRLDNLKASLDDELEALKEKAKERYDESVSDETLIAEAKKEIMSKSQDEILDLLDEYAEKARAKGKNFGTEYIYGLKESLLISDLMSNGAVSALEQLQIATGKRSLNLTDQGYPSSIQGYATGGIATSKQLAWVAEDEPEAIIPMSKMYGFVNSILSGSQEVLSKAYFAMQRMMPIVGGGDTYSTSQIDQSRTVHIENINISRTVDFDLASAQIGALVGGRR